MTDPIADMLTRIRNANTSKHDTVDVPASKMKLAIADILVKEGYVAKYDLVEDGTAKNIRITLKYGKDKNEKIISGLKRISGAGAGSGRGAAGTSVPDADGRCTETRREPETGVKRDEGGIPCFAGN